MRRLPIFLALMTLALAGCKDLNSFDIDLSCKGQYPVWDSHAQNPDLSIREFDCSGTNQDWTIQCAADTVQQIGNVYTCTTKDKKSVRITVIQ